MYILYIEDCSGADFPCTPCTLHFLQFFDRTLRMEKSIFDTIDPRMLERIRAFRLMDDDFMTIVFSSDPKAAEFLLRIILERDDLTVKSCMSQQEKRNLYGRSVILDIIAEDTEHKLYNIEIQRSDKGNSPKRVRYNAAMIDSHTLHSGKDFTDLPELYIIFITEHDYLKLKKPYYKVKKYFDVTDKNGQKIAYDDGINVMYVNGTYRGNDAIGKLMHDFCTPNADDMYYAEIAKRVKFHKQEEQGVGKVCRVWEQYGDERETEGIKKGKLTGLREGKRVGLKEGKKEMAARFLKDGTLSVQKIAEISGFSLEQVQKMAEEISR